MFKDYIKFYVAGAFLVLLFQNCGGAGTPVSSSNQSSSSNGTSPQAINLLSTVVVSNVQLVFNIANLRAGATVNWGSSLNQNTPCIEVNSTNSGDYTVVCGLGGTVLVTALITQSGQTPVYISSRFRLGTGPLPTVIGGPPPVPTPTPKPATGQLLVDQLVYAPNCAHCHGDIDYSGVRGATLQQLVDAIRGNVGQMAFAATLTPQQLDQIIFALNNQP